MVVSQTTINPVGVYLQENNRRVVHVEPVDFFDEKTGLAPDTTNTLLDESAGADQILLILDYEIDASEDIQVKVSANNVDILSTTEKYHSFGEGLLIKPQKSIEITESHTNRTIPIKIKVHAIKYYLE